MIEKWLCRSVMIGGILATALSAPMASACSFNIPIEYQPDPSYDIRQQCRSVYRDREEILIDLERGKKSFSDYAEVARAFAEGLGKCKKRPGLALAMADAAIGSPVRAGAPTQFFLNLAPDDFPEARKQEIAVDQWLNGSTYRPGYCSSGYYADYLPSKLSAEEIRPTLLTDQYWQVAIAQFGYNPGRDRLVLRELTQPSGPKFDLGLASYLVPQFKRSVVEDDERREMQVEIAEALIDARLRTPAYEVAAGLLDWYSPYKKLFLSDEEIARIESLWTRINQTRLTNADPEIAKQALVALQTGDPHAKPGTPLSEVIPANEKIVVLDKWPDSLPAFARVEWWAERIARNYPQSALRQYQAGRVDYGIIFKPDGSFHSLHVTKSAGETLDRAALQGARRYIRPRVNQLKLIGYEGGYVYVPLPSNEYHYGYRESDFPNNDPIGNFTIYVTGWNKVSH